MITRICSFERNCTIYYAIARARALNEISLKIDLSIESKAVGIVLRKSIAFKPALLIFKVHYAGRAAVSNGKAVLSCAV